MSRTCAGETTCSDCLKNHPDRGTFEDCYWHDKTNTCYSWFDSPNGGGSKVCPTTIWVIVGSVIGLVVLLIICALCCVKKSSKTAKKITSYKNEPVYKTSNMKSNNIQMNNVQMNKPQQIYQPVSQNNTGIKCNKCNHISKNGSKFCQGCGNLLSIECIKCGQSVNENVKFCSNCGNPVNGNSNIQPSVPNDDDIPGDDDKGEGLPGYDNVGVTNY